MPTIKPISELQRNLREIADECHETRRPVYLTKNGRGCYAIVDISDLERSQAADRLVAELDAGAVSAREKRHSLEDIRREFGLD